MNKPVTKDTKGLPNKIDGLGDISLMHCMIYGQSTARVMICKSIYDSRMLLTQAHITNRLQINIKFNYIYMSMD